MNNDLGVRLTVEMVALPFERFPKLFEVVNFAVKNSPDGAVFVVDRLMAACNINDAEPSHAQGGAVCDVIAGVIGSPVHHGIAHCANVFLQTSPHIEIKYSGN